MEAAGNKRKAKNKQWYKAQKKRKFSLCPDIKGFLCFCNFREKEAIREAYNILNQHFNEESQVGKDQPDTLAAENESEEDDGDIEAQLEREKAALKTEHESSEEQRRFQVNSKALQSWSHILTIDNGQPPFLPLFYIHVQNVLCVLRESLVLTFLDLYDNIFIRK